MAEGIGQEVSTSQADLRFLKRGICIHLGCVMGGRLYSAAGGCESGETVFVPIPLDTRIWT